MTDRGYWARLGLEGIEPHGDDHPLGFAYGSLRNGVLPRMAVLLQQLTTQAQLDAFNALLRELSRFSRQTHGVLEDLRAQARHFKDLEDAVTFESRDLEELRQSMRKYPDFHQHFDPETYKRSSLATKDLFDACYTVDWERAAAIGHSLDRRMAEKQAREEKESAERRQVEAQEARVRRDAYLLESVGVLYKTGPKGVDDSIPKNVRADIPAAEKRLEAMGFTVQVEGDQHCCTRAWGAYVVYADPRGGNSLRFNVYKGAECLHTFWLKDKLGDPKAKVEAQLSKLQEQDLGTEGFLDIGQIAKLLQVSPYQVEHLIGRGLPVAIVGSHKRFDQDKVLDWVKQLPQKTGKERMT